MTNYYCNDPKGFMCSNNFDGNKCNGGFFCSCSHKTKTPILFLKDKPQPQKRTDTDCNYCVHKDVCKDKAKFNNVKKMLYPVICECKNFKKPDYIIPKTENLLK